MLPIEVYFIVERVKYGYAETSGLVNALHVAEEFGTMGISVAIISCCKQQSMNHFMKSVRVDAVVSEEIHH
jgi:hypothetical protein